MSDQLPDDEGMRPIVDSAAQALSRRTGMKLEITLGWAMIALEAAAPAIAAQGAAAERERIRRALRNRASGERDEAILARSPSAADRHIHAGAALDAAADLAGETQ